MMQEYFNNISSILVVIDGCMVLDLPKNSAFLKREHFVVFRRITLSSHKVHHVSATGGYIIVTGLLFFPAFNLSLLLIPYNAL